MSATPVRQPLTPAGCDLMNYPRMPVIVQRLLSSETWIESAADPRLGHVLMSLWAASWHQVPTASLPSADGSLYRMSMCPTEREWRRVRARVLRDWVLCSDGRLYHPVLAELAIECWIDKLAQRRRSETGNAKKYGRPVDVRQIDQLEAQALSMLRELNPNSAILTKKRTVLTIPVSPGAASGGSSGPASGGPSGSGSALPEGSQKDPLRTPEGLLQGSQEKRRDISPKPPDPGSGQVGGGQPPAGGTMPAAVREALAALIGSSGGEVRH